MKKKTVVPFVTIPLIAILLLGTFPAIASGGWSEDVNQLGWEIVNMTNNTTNGVLDILTGFVSGTTGGQFDINYKQFVEGGHWKYANPVVDVPGHYGDCLEGWEVNPENEAQCRLWVESEVCDYFCPTDQVFTASHQVCPAEDSAYTSWMFWLPCKRKIGCQWRYADKVTESFSVTFSYDKWSQDPHKCHRPTASSLDIPSWAVNDFNQQFPELKYAEEVCTDTSHYEYADRFWIPDTYACPVGYEEDPENTEQCRLWINTSDYQYVERGWIPDTYACPIGYESNPEGENCRKWVDESAWIYQTITYYIEVSGKEKPVCDPFEGCVGIPGLWENIMGGFETGPSLYGTGPQTIDVTWTSANICEWDGTACEPSQPFVAIKVRSVVGQTSDTQTSFIVKVKGVDYPAEVVHAADGVDWYVLRFQIDGYPLYPGVNVISDKSLWLLDDTGSQHWRKTNNVAPRVYKNNMFPNSCSDAPDFGDTRIVNGVMEMGRFPGTNTSDVIHFLVLNNVPYDEAETWATETWHSLAFGEYAPVPASFSPVAP